MPAVGFSCSRRLAGIERGVCPPVESDEAVRTVSGGYGILVDWY
jgi:hypothetical protein